MNTCITNSAINQLKQLTELHWTGFNYFFLGYFSNRYTIKQDFYLHKCVRGLINTLKYILWIISCRSLFPFIIFNEANNSYLLKFLSLTKHFEFLWWRSTNGNMGPFTTKLIAFIACNILPEFSCGASIITIGVGMSLMLSAAALAGISKLYFITSSYNCNILCMNKCNDQPG